MSAARRRSTEDGFVMVITMLVMTIGLIVAGVAMSDTLTARHLTENDRRAAAAQQAADSGLQIALYRVNQMNLGKTDFNSGLSGLTSTLSCLLAGLDVNAYVSALTPIALGVGTSCPSQSGASSSTPIWKYERLGNRTTFAYQFIPGGKSTGGSAGAGHASLNPVIVAVGREDNGTATTSDDVVRRAEEILNPVDPFDMVEATGNLTFNGTLATVFNGDVRANGNITLGGLGVVGANVLGSDGSILRLANIQYGGSISGLLQVASTTHTTSSFTRAPVSISPAKADCGTTAPAGACPALGYNSVTHKLTLTGSQSITLGAGDYVFCGVSVASGATLNTSVAADSPTRIFIDSPSSARCTGIASSGNLALNGRLNTISLTPSQLQIYMAGNGTPGGTTATIDTTVLGGTVTPAFFLYAPDSDVTMSFALFQGNVIGHDVTMSPACLIKILGICIPGLVSVLTQDLGINNMPLSSAVGVFSRKQYVPCTANEPPAATPTKDC